MMKSGKLDEKLSRMSEVADHLNPGSLMLFNESFAATNEREGSEIFRQITKALIDCNVEVFSVTHLYTYASAFLNEPNTQFLRQSAWKMVSAPLGLYLASLFRQLSVWTCTGKYSLEGEIKCSGVSFTLLDFGRVKRSMQFMDSEKELGRILQQILKIFRAEIRA